MNADPASLAPAWRPPSAQLTFVDGLWRAAGHTPISYPDSGNAVCFQVEDESFWFRHRLECIRAALQQFPPSGTLYDIGGGNGQLAAALQAEGREVALLEPGPGAENARTRGVRRIIQATLEDAQLQPGKLPAAGAFDVIEHLPDDGAFLQHIRRLLAPGARFYCTVPAMPALWSEDDRFAGHFRRYRRTDLQQVMERAGFTLEFASSFFTALTLPVLLFRVLPSALRLRDKTKLGALDRVRHDHRLPPSFAGLMARIQAWELRRLHQRRPLPFGTSLLAVARVD